MESLPSSNRFRRYPKTTLVVVVLLLILILDVALTGVYHVYKYGTIHKFDHRRALRVPSDIFHHTLKPNDRHAVEKWGDRSHILSTNSLGFKDRTPRNVPLASPNVRLLFLGDSFTEGVGLEYEQTFVGLIDTALQPHNIEVMNAGVASYSPAIYFKKTEYLLEQVGLKVDHVFVFLDISDIQDEGEDYDIRDNRVIWVGGGMSGLRDFLFEYTGLLKNLWIACEKISGIVYRAPDTGRTQKEQALGVNMYRSLWTLDEKVYEEYGKVGLQKSGKHMTQLSQLLKRHNVALTVAVYPWPDQVFHRDLDSLQVQYWQNWAEENGVRFFNLFPRFIHHDRDPTGDIEHLFIRGDVHWNQEGHQFIADEFLSFFRANYSSFKPEAYDTIESHP
ncbi:MAG: SGNH/GDSL hydrolase family protein [Nitrospirales bacterium]|nr:GDSL-type esterase/lipase family protein [Nitrospirales bacterium]